MGVGGEAQSITGEANWTLQVPVTRRASDVLLGPPHSSTGKQVARLCSR